MREKISYRVLKKVAKRLGVDIFGIADIKGIKEELNFSSELIKDMDYALSLGVRLSGTVLEEIGNYPTKLYYFHYRIVNHFLDQIAFRLTQFIQDRGYRALPIPASQIIDWERQRGHLSHKKVAYLAGLGWLGRNNLIVNPKFGSQIRLVTVLTDMPLKVDNPLNRDCGDCRKCLLVCPVKAIKERLEEFDHSACFEKLKEFRKQGYVDQFICGICVKVCHGE